MNRSATARIGPGLRLATVRLALAVLTLLAVGCAVDVQDGVGPRVPEPDVEGDVARGSSPAIHVDVELHDVASDVKVFDSRSNRYGGFMFFAVPSGLWEVRAESGVPGDFASVRRQFYRADGDGRVRLRMLDVSAHGAALAAPTAGARAPTPTPFVPLDFRWTSPAVAGAVAQVQLYDESSVSVWRSSTAATESATWYGYGTEGAYQGVPVGPGRYQWRVKFEFPDTSEARTGFHWLQLE